MSGRSVRPLPTSVGPANKWTDLPLAEGEPEGWHLFRHQDGAGSEGLAWESGFYPEQVGGPSVLRTRVPSSWTEYVLRHLKIEARM